MLPGEIKTVKNDTLVGEVAQLKVARYRFVTMSCVELDAECIEILYHFDNNLNLVNFRLTVAKNTPVVSISPVFFAAFLVENEIQDLFGVTFEGLVLNYERTLYLEGEVKTTPFLRYTVMDERKPTVAKADSATSSPGHSDPVPSI